MSNKVLTGVIIALIAIFLFIFVFPMAFIMISIKAAGDYTSPKLTVETLAKRIGLAELPNCEITYNVESHGGFLGDGSTGIICCFESEEGAMLETMLAAAEHWSPMPMDTQVADILYGTKTIKVSTIKNGYYFFYDKQTENYFIADDFFDRHSYNYYISAYDSDKMLLYYYGNDT